MLYPPKTIRDSIKKRENFVKGVFLATKGGTKIEEGNGEMRQGRGGRGDKMGDRFSRMKKDLSRQSLDQLRLNYFFSTDISIYRFTGSSSS